MENSIENQLKNLILSKFKSLREFAIKIDMPYSTIDTILKRGLDKASIGNVIKICKSLNISADNLADGKIVFTYNDKKNNIISIDGLSDESIQEIQRFAEFVRSKEEAKKGDTTKYGT